jgi:hypothetical protein
MHVDARLALNQLWDHGGQHGQESEEGEGKEEGRQEEKEVGLADTRLTETRQGACALPSRGRYCRGLMWFSDLKIPSRTTAPVSADWSGFFIEQSQF